ncbi:hypothetical protein BRPE64_BCDS02620 [Caballeronia insecticola]|uniref:Uncharacterized protein n=1 Tax=Caballeronia insecticola TaxID=758793 RepID=R4WK60_9BURK|nr:hypothetical protein BRPE64_BCDS02620 [Caballeronia insecticola]
MLNAVGEADPPRCIARGGRGRKYKGWSRCQGMPACEIGPR